MRHLSPRSALALAAALALPAHGCQQSDQELPFELDAAGLQTIGPSGGTVSLPPNFSVAFPAGAFAEATQVTVDVLTTAFPSDAGVAVPNTAYVIGSTPAGAQLLVPATVQISVPEDLLQAGEDIRLTLALQTSTGALSTDAESYDLENGILTGEIGALGSVAAVVGLDAIPVGDLASIPPLGGGSIAPPSPAPQPTGPALTSHDVVRFEANCSTAERQCFSSGILQLWVDDLVRDRLGEDIVFAETTVEAYFEFMEFVLDVPTRAEASLYLDGELRARLNRVVAGRRAGDEVTLFTGNGTSAVPTALSFSGNQLVLAETSEDDPELVPYAVTGIGTGEQLIVRLDGTLEFDDGDPPGRIVADVRLRR